MTYRYRIAIIFLVGFFIDCINIFMSAIALPDIARNLSVSESTVTWVANSYILGLTLIIPISNWLASRFGTRQIMIASMLIFSIAAFFAGMATHFLSLALFRFVQGLGGGLLIPVGQALTLSLFKKHERAKISTIIMAVALIAPAVSPGVGGIIVDHFSWHWVFFSNIPFSLIAALLSFLWIKTEKTTAPKPDLSGLFLVSLSLASLLLGLSLYAEASTKLVPYILVITGVLFALLYVRHYRRINNPVLDLNILTNIQMRFSIWVYYAVPGVFTGVNLLNIFYLQQELNWSAEKAGLLMLFYAAGSFCAILVCGRIYNQLGSVRLFFTGLVLHAAGIAILATVNTSQDQPLLIMAYLLMGIGGGIGANTAQTTAMLDFEGEDLSRASTIWNLNRQICFSIGATIFAMIFNVLQHKTTPATAYHLTFIIAAMSGLLPLLKLRQLTKNRETV
ncbi:MFS transporter [Xenorhabdus bovienii]|uniref:MFS transporter n=1 Tax=Xenorhabdus bovienii TaxID=40576 RepID=UPI0023B341F6|nr:MFS transporter [Xenorhabdus bovienii]MDE9535235.1 MFS transporter [Xenorhabdus bovienii]MDE9587247.1 MFS transporter [Xenorhabdus bovienii]